MKFMLILGATADTESGRMPSDDELNAMGAFNERLIDNGVLLAGEGLHPTLTGAIVRFSGGESDVNDGPFAEGRTSMAGFWIISVASRDEALEIAQRVPISSGEVEVRQIYDVMDFNQDNEYVQKEHEWRAEHGESRTA